MTAKKKSSKKSVTPRATPEVAVIIGTELRNLWFGYATDTSGDTVVLRRARQVIYWSSDVKGAGGLAVTGPSKSCRIGPAVPEVQCRRVTTVAIPTSEAVAAFEASPWAS